MATQSVRSYKFTTVRMLNYLKPGNGWTVDSVLTPADLTLTDIEVMRWFHMRVWGHPDPAPDHAYLPLVRSNSILYWKKNISFFMPNKMQPWDHIGNSGNPTRCNAMASLIKQVRRMEARGIGKPSEARDSISEIQFRLMNQVLLDKDASIVEKYGIPALTKFQFHMISRIDDSTLFFANHLKPHDNYPDFCLKARLNWAKNVNEEREAPYQALIGSMNQQYCIFIALGIWLEASLNAFPWAATSPYVFSFKNDHRVPDGATKSKAHVQRTLHVVFKEHDEFAETKLGSHSVRKYASTTVRNLGATKDEKDIRGRWKSSTRVSDVYDDVELPFPDAKLAGLLCPGGPIRYAIMPGSGVTRAFIVDRVVPKIKAKFGGDVAYVLGTALLWVLHSPYFAMMPAMLRDDIRIAYADVKPAGFNENPMQKIPLIICGNEGRVHMVDAPQGFHAAIQQQDGAVIVQQGNNNNPHNNALPMGFQDRPVQDQMMVLYSQNAILGREFSELRASVENNAATNLRNYNVLNRNINRIAMAPARRIAGPVAAGQNAAPAAGQAGNNNNQQQVGPANIEVGGGTLSPLPRTLYDLWVEYQTGIGGRKAARDFTARERGADKYRYYRRKHVWNIVANLVNAGVQARVAVDRIYSHYGANKPVTRIIKDIMHDKRNGGLPLVLRV
jgi:hypothetical protein